MRQREEPSLIRQKICAFVHLSHNEILKSRVLALFQENVLSTFSQLAECGRWCVSFSPQAFFLRLHNLSLDCLRITPRGSKRKFKLLERFAEDFQTQSVWMDVMRVPLLRRMQQVDQSSFIGAHWPHRLTSTLISENISSFWLQLLC